MAQPKFGKTIVQDAKQGMHAATVFIMHGAHICGVGAAGFIKGPGPDCGNTLGGSPSMNVWLDICLCQPLQGWQNRSV